MKYKKEVLDFLREKEVQLFKAIAENEIHYRTATAMFIAKPKNDQINAFHTQTKLKGDALSSELRHLQGLIKEIEEGKFEIA